MDTLLVGYGNWGKKVYAKCLEIDGLDITGGVEPDWLGIPKDLDMYPDCLSVPNDWYDAAIICTPPMMRVEVVRALALRGIKRFHISKPVACSERDANELHALQAMFDLDITVGHTTVHSLEFKWLRESLKRSCGVWHANSYRVATGIPNHEVSALWDLASHNVAMLCELFGWSGAIVSRSTIEDGGKAHCFTLTWPQGNTATVEVSYWNNLPRRELHVWRGAHSIMFDEAGVNMGDIDTPDALHNELIAFRDSSNSVLFAQGLEVVRILASAEKLRGGVCA